MRACRWCRGKGVCPSPWMHPTKDHPSGFVKCERCSGTGNEPVADDAKRGAS